MTLQVPFLRVSCGRDAVLHLGCSLGSALQVGICSWAGICSLCALQAEQLQKLLWSGKARGMSRGAEPELSELPCCPVPGLQVGWQEQGCLLSPH